MEYSLGGRFRRRARLLAGLLCAVLLLGGCGSSAWTYDPITDVNDLEGRRVGVCLSWEADFFLTGRKDMELYRYDTIADMLMAISYDKVDALAVDNLIWKMVSAQSDGLARVEPPFGTTGYLVYFSPENEALMEDFNAFLAEYKQTEDYQDFLLREASFDGLNYEGPEIPLTGTGPVLRVAVDIEAFPRGFCNPGDPIPEGFDVEAVKRFANDRNYRLEFAQSNYTDAFTGLQHGIYDMATGYFSDAYREGVLNTGLYVSDGMDETPMVFVQKTRQDIRADVDALS